MVNELLPSLRRRTRCVEACAPTRNLFNVPMSSGNQRLLRPPNLHTQSIVPLSTRILASMGTTGSGIAGGDAGKGSAIGGLDVTAMMGDDPKPIKELFPVTLQDPRTGRQYWHESPAVTEAVAKELFDKCSQPPPVEKGPGGGGGSGGGGGAPARARVSGVQMSLGKLMGHPAITGGREKRVDVDDALWLFMRHWLVGGNRS